MSRGGAGLFHDLSFWKSEFSYGKNHPQNICSVLVRTISICLYFARGRLYKRFNFEVEVSLGKFSKQVCITSESGRPTRGI